MENNIKVVLLGCIPKGRGKKCKVSTVNAKNKWHAQKIISKCRETHRGVKGSCKPIITYNAKTRVPLKM